MKCFLVSEKDTLPNLNFWLEKGYIQKVEKLELLGKPEALYMLKQKDSFAFVDIESSPVLMELFSHQSVPMREASCFDFIHFQNEKYWPELFLMEALSQKIVLKAPKLNTHSIAYVTGSTAMVRLVIAVLFKLGFKQFNIVSDDLDQSALLVEELKRKFFSINITLIKNTELTLQPNNGSVLMNTLSFGSNSIILEDLYYLNFISKDGLVVDLNFFSAANNLVDEAKHVSILYLTGIEVGAYRDFLMLKSILKDFKITFESYLDLFEKFLAKQENNT